MVMKVVSVNVSMPIETTYEQRRVATGIFKTPISGPVEVGRLNLAGDGQADLSVHGGVDKAVYAYSVDHYAYWRAVLGLASLPYGQFGENLSVSELDEKVSCIGDRLQIGTAIFAITQPRVPCFKLGMRFDNAALPRMFTESGRTGFYMKVLCEGNLTSGDAVHVVEKQRDSVAVHDLFRAYLGPPSTASRELLTRAAAIPDLAEEWRRKIQSRL